MLNKVNKIFLKTILYSILFFKKKVNKKFFKTIYLNNVLQH